MTFTETEATDHPREAPGATPGLDDLGRRDPLAWLSPAFADQAAVTATTVASRTEMPVSARHVLVRTSAEWRVSARHVLVTRSEEHTGPRHPRPREVPAACTREAVAALALTVVCAVVLMTTRGTGLAAATAAALACLVPGLGIHSLRRSANRSDAPALVLLLSLSWSTLVGTACAYARLTQPVVLFVLVALPGVLGGLITARRSPLHLRRVARWAPGPAWRSDTPACVAYAAAASSMLIAFLRLDPAAVGEWGLLPALGPAFVAGVVAVIVVVVASAVARRPAWVSALGLGLVMCAFTLPPALAAGGLLGGWSYKHLGVVDLIRSGGAVSDPRDLFQSWPGFFAAAADVDRLSGAQDVTYANEAALLFLAVASVALWTATVRLLPGRRDVAAVAVLILAVTQWESQIYYSPQSLAWSLSMLMLALILPQLPLPQRRVPSRLPRPVRDVLSWLWRGDGPKEFKPDADEFLMYALGLGVLAVIVTHQLTPWMMMFQLSALMVVGWFTPMVRLLLLLLGVGAVGWLLVHHSAVSQASLFTGFRIGNASGLPQQATSAPQELAAGAARLIAFVVWGGTLLVALMSFRRPARVAVALALAFAPFLLIFTQDYGGEAIYRVWLFSSPWCAVILAERILALGRGRLVLAPTLGLACSVAFMGSTTATSFGMYRVVSIPADEVAASEWYYSSTPPGSVLVLASASFPQRAFAGYATHNPMHILNEPDLSDDQALRGAGLDSMSAHQLAGYARRRWGASVYLAVAASMKQENSYFHTFQPAALDRLVDRLGMSSEWQVVYQNGDTVIFRVLSPSPSAP